MSFENERRRMILSQLTPRGIQDPRVLEVMGKVPRHLFVPKNVRQQSYADHPVPIGEGQTISQPYMVALMTQELRVGPQSRVLDVGTGSGYQTALLAEIASQVYSIERISTLGIQAARILKRLGYRNVQIRIGDGTSGWPEEAPFDRIMVTAASPSIPEPLVSQLAPGGILVAPIGSAFDQTLTVVEKVDERVLVRSVCGCVFVPLIGEHGWKQGQVHEKDPHA